MPTGSTAEPFRQIPSMAPGEPGGVTKIRAGASLSCRGAAGYPSPQPSTMADAPGKGALARAVPVPGVTTMTRILSISATAAAAMGLLLLPPTSVASTTADTGWSFPSGLVESAPAWGGMPAVPGSAEGTSAADPIDTDWRTLLGLNYRTGEVTAALESRRGKPVRIPGFMVPFEDGMSGVNEFLLVPYFGACIHTPPPPPNQIVYVRMEGSKRVEVNIWDAVYVEGVLDIESIESPYGTVGHQVLGSAVKPYGRDQ
ncbi:MAG: DUF3299 domain-containing protein [Gemmatimonadales bacterium]|nr:MAG: DUF3299 domain-containing protein [Gemmatimonadales bacterium]